MTGKSKDWYQISAKYVHTVFTLLYVAIYNEPEQ